jgi:hypothetical protein
VGEDLFKRWKDWLWPVGGAILGLIVMPVAIAQYPQFFNENRELLPISVLVVLACWVIPLLVHNRAKLYIGNAWAWGNRGKALAKVGITTALFLFILGGVKLRKLHVTHLDTVLASQRASTPPPENRTLQQGGTEDRDMEFTPKQKQYLKNLIAANAAATKKIDKPPQPPTISDDALHTLAETLKHQMQGRFSQFVTDNETKYTEITLASHDNGELKQAKLEAAEEKLRASDLLPRN